MVVVGAGVVILPTVAGVDADRDIIVDIPVPDDDEVDVAG